MGLDRLDCHEQSLGDVLVAGTGGGHRSDPLLGSGQRVDAGGIGAADALAGCPQFVHGAVKERLRARGAGDLARLPQRAPRLGAAVGAAQRGAVGPALAVAATASAGPGVMITPSAGYTIDSCRSSQRTR
jgi:hypothetical protein